MTTIRSCLPRHGRHCSTATPRASISRPDGAPSGRTGGLEERLLDLAQRDDLDVHPLNRRHPGALPLRGHEPVRPVGVPAPERGEAGRVDGPLGCLALHGDRIPAPPEEDEVDLVVGLVSRRNSSRMSLAQYASIHSWKSPSGSVGARKKGGGPPRSIRCSRSARPKAARSRTTRGARKTTAFRPAKVSLKRAEAPSVDEPVARTRSLGSGLSGGSAGRR